MYIDKEDTINIEIISLNRRDYFLIAQVNIDSSVALIFCIFHAAGFLVGQILVLLKLHVCIFDFLHFHTALAWLVLF